MILAPQRMNPISEILRSAVEAHQRGRVDLAETLYRQVLEIEPNHADGLHLLGVVLHQRGEHAAGAASIERAIAARPDPQAHYYTNLGETYRALKRYDDAAAAQQRAIAINPGFPEARVNLGLVLQDLGRHRDAAAAFAEAVHLRPDYIAAWGCFARACATEGLLDQAAAAARQMIQLAPALVEGYQILGESLSHGAQPVAAEQALRQALEMKPDDGRSWAAIAEPLREVGRVDEAIAALRRAVELEPENAAYHSRLLFVMNESPSVPPQALAEEHRNWAARHAAPLEPSRRKYSNDRKPNRRLRIGYISPDLREHVVARFFEPILRAHDRGRFEIFCYASVARPDAVSERLEAHCNRWRNVWNDSDDRVAEQIRRDQVDVLIDLAGHSPDHRLLVLARRPAPVQFTYLGYPNSTGMRAIDYRITDALADPSGETDALYSEKLVRLAVSFLCFAPPLEDAPEEPPPRAGAPLTFGSFNRGSKITEPVVVAWSAILRSVPSARLLLKGKTAAESAACEVRRAQFAHHGIHPARIVFPPPVIAHADHLREYEQVDIALDTWPYNGTTTTCEALWMGVPVIALAGTTHASRVGVSLLTHAGLPELIASDSNGYVNIAVALASDPHRLAALRKTLRARMRSSPLMNAAEVTRQIEQAYRSAWITWCDAQQP